MKAKSKDLEKLAESGLKVNAEKIILWMNKN